MHDDRILVQTRLQRLVDQFIRPAQYGATVPLTVAANILEGEPVSYAEAMAGEFVPFHVGSGWGRPWGTAWFRIDRKSTRLNSSHVSESRMPSSA